MKLLGREPALIIGAIGSLITALVALNLPGLDAGAGAAITAVTTALVIAATTRPVAPALFTGVVAAGAVLLAEYGYHVSDGIVAALGGAIVAGCTLFGIRPQVTPVADPDPAFRQ